MCAHIFTYSDLFPWDQQAGGSPAANGGLTAPFDEADFSDPTPSAPNGVSAAPYSNASGVGVDDSAYPVLQLLSIFTFCSQGG